MTSKRKKILVTAIVLLILPVVAIGAVALGAWVAVRRSLPKIEGEIVLRGLHAQVRIERDGQGVPTIRAGDREDLAFGLGFVHGQDRFFQMDGLRRHAAGELAEIFGAGPEGTVVTTDRRVRVMRFRAVAQEVVAKLRAAERRQLDAYVEGVRTGLGSLGARPFEYLLLGVSPRPWVAEDSVLVVLSLFIDLQADNIAKESAAGSCTTSCRRHWLSSSRPGGRRSGTHRCSAGRSHCRRYPARRSSTSGENPNWRPTPRRGSSWKTSWRGATTGLLRPPELPMAGRGSPTTCTCTYGCPAYGTGSIWIILPRTGPGGAQSVIGVTVPGGPGIVVGSNSRIAWGFTNTQGDWSDLVELEIPPDNPDCYMSPDGLRPIDRHREVIRVKGEPDVELTVEATIWGPVLGKDHLGRKCALRWVACDPNGVDLGLLDLSSSRSLEEGLNRANRCGAPTRTS